MTSINSLEPFLPLSCGLPHGPLRRPPSDSAETANALRTGSSSAVDPEEAILFAGTGLDVRRVLKRAMRSHLYGRKRAADARSGVEQIESQYDGEEPFQILVLGGSGKLLSPLVVATC